MVTLNKKVIVIALFLFSIFVFAYSALIGIDQSYICEDSSKVYYYNQSEYSGIVINKRTHCIRNNVLITVLSEKDTVTHQLGIPYSCMYDYIKINDSIVKRLNTLEYIVIRSGIKKSFYMDCETKCSCYKTPPW
jgi:hypothetical protein